MLQVFGRTTGCASLLCQFGSAESTTNPQYTIDVKSSDVVPLLNVCVVSNELNTVAYKDFKY